jgi:hypothetical protein
MCAEALDHVDAPFERGNGRLTRGAYLTEIKQQDEAWFALYRRASALAAVPRLAAWLL